MTLSCRSHCKEAGGGRIKSKSYSRGRQSNRQVHVVPSVPGSQHPPILLRVTLAAKARETPFQRGCNFCNGNWDSSSKDLESQLTFDSVVKNYEKYIECDGSAPNRNIRGRARTKHIPGFLDSAKDHLNACNRE